MKVIITVNLLSNFKSNTSKLYSLLPCGFEQKYNVQIFFFTYFSSLSFFCLLFSSTAFQISIRPKFFLYLLAASLFQALFCTPYTIFGPYFFLFLLHYNQFFRTIFIFQYTILFHEFSFSLFNIFFSLEFLLQILLLQRSFQCFRSNQVFDSLINEPKHFKYILFLYSLYFFLFLPFLYF